MKKKLTLKKRKLSDITSEGLDDVAGGTGDYCQESDNTCDPTCPHTCGGDTCEGTCYASCGGTCPNTCCATCCC